MTVTFVNGINRLRERFKRSKLPEALDKTLTRSTDILFKAEIGRVEHFYVSY